MLHAVNVAASLQPVCRKLPCAEDSSCFSVHVACRYDPYGRVLVIERYDQEGMRAVRRRAVEAARSASSFGLVLGTLGRQGNPRILEHLQGLLTKRGIPFTNVRHSQVLCACSGWESHRRDGTCPSWQPQIRLLRAKAGNLRTCVGVSSQTQFCLLEHCLGELAHSSMLRCLVGLGLISEAKPPGIAVRGGAVEAGANGRCGCLDPDSVPPPVY